MSTQSTIPALLRSHGLRITPQRLAVAELVLHQPVHMTARSAYQTLRQQHPAISMNTIYLTLGQFESSGLMQSFEVGGHTVFDSNTKPHHHACCRQCNSIMDITCQQTELTLQADQLAAWEIESEQRIWVGLCPDCKQDRKP